MLLLCKTFTWQWCLAIREQIILLFARYELLIVTSLTSLVKMQILVIPLPLLKHSLGVQQCCKLRKCLPRTAKIPGKQKSAQYSD